MLIPGLVSVTFRHLTPAQIIQACVDHQLKAIEWGGDLHVPHGNLAVARAVGQHMRDAGLAVSAYGSYYRASQSEAAGLPFTAVLDSASALGADTIRVWSGTVGSDIATDEDRDWVVADLQRICELSAARGMTIATEFHGGTITDNAEVTMDVLARVGASNLRTFWQPPVGGSVANNLAGLKQVLPKLANLHVFHWWPTAADRKSLADGAAAWGEYLRAVPASEPRYASLEFVQGDQLEQLSADAKTLRTWLSAMTD